MGALVRYGEELRQSKAGPLDVLHLPLNAACTPLGVHRDSKSTYQPLKTPPVNPPFPPSFKSDASPRDFKSTSSLGALYEAAC